MISQEIEECLDSIKKIRNELATAKNDALAYRLQMEEKRALQTNSETKVIDWQKVLELKLKILQGLMDSPKHYAPHFATVGALLEKLDAATESSPQADGDSSIQIGREG